MVEEQRTSERCESRKGQRKSTERLFYLQVLGNAGVTKTLQLHVTRDIFIWCICIQLNLTNFGRKQKMKRSM